MQKTEIKAAGTGDVQELGMLVNSAYRGESSKAGWTTEAHFLDGIRIDIEALRELIEMQGSVILTAIEDGKIIGCVNLQKQGSKLYLGMLTVSPLIQARGIGKELLKASEVYAVKQLCGSIVMTVISIRSELIEWYKRRGYNLTGEKKAFPSDNARLGLPRQNLELAVMEKYLT